MNNDARLVMKLIAWGLALSAIAIGAAIARRKQRRRHRDALSGLSEAIRHGKCAEAFDLARLLFTAPCTLKGKRKQHVRTLQETIAVQLQAAELLDELVRAHEAGDATSQVQGISLALARQQRITSEKGLFSFVHGAPKKDAVEAFDAAQNEKEQLAQALSAEALRPLR